jgi:hypothetical protein
MKLPISGVYIYLIKVRSPHFFSFCSPSKLAWKRLISSGRIFYKTSINLSKLGKRGITGIVFLRLDFPGI